jgi:predicted DNA-binding transcriptional regulator AlpA
MNEMQQPEAPAAVIPAVEALLIPDTLAAALAGISRSTWHSLRAAGKIGPAPIKLGRAVRWNRVEVESWIANGCPDKRSWEAMQAGAKGRARLAVVR